MQTEFWHGILKITQVPTINAHTENEHSWLCNPFGNHQIYCTRFKMFRDTFSWEFIFKENVKQKALGSARNFLAFLKEIYPGLSGFIYTKPITRESLEEKKVLYELVLPEPPFHKKVNLIQKVMNLFCNRTNSKMEVYLFWSQTDDIIGELQGTEAEKEFRLQEDYYKLKIFITITNPLKNREAQLRSFTSDIDLLSSLQIGISNADHQRASLREIPDFFYENLLNFVIFYKNRDNIDTGLYYRKIKDQIKPELFPSFVNAKSIDFTIPNDFLLPRAKTLPYENYGNFTYSKTDLSLGNWIRYGEIQKVMRYIKFDDLLHHMFISGLSGAGKTYFCYHLKREIAAKLPNVGTLIINLKKSDEENGYCADINLKYTDEKFQVPYIFFTDEDITGTIELFSNLLVASLGLPDYIEHALVNSTTAIYNKYHKLPSYIGALFPPVLKWFEEMSPYDEKIKKRAISAIKNRVTRLLNSIHLKQILMLTEEIPDWFKQWKQGKDVFIDLSGCKSMRKKRLIINFLFQMIKNFTPQLNAKDSSPVKLKHVIILDEVSEILQELKRIGLYDDELIARNYMENVFSDMLGAFRSRGVALVLVDQKPSRLYDCVHSLPSIKILFRTAHSCSHLFVKSVEEQDFLESCEQRRAMIIDGVNGFKYQFYTPSFNPYTQKVGGNSNH